MPCANGRVCLRNDVRWYRAMSFASVFPRVLGTQWIASTGARHDSSRANGREAWLLKERPLALTRKDGTRQMRLRGNAKIVST